MELDKDGEKTIELYVTPGLAYFVGVQLSLCDQSQSQQFSEDTERMSQMWLTTAGIFDSMFSQGLKLTGDSACIVLQSPDPSLLVEIAALEPSAKVVIPESDTALPLEAHIMSLPPAVRAVSAFVSLFCTRLSAYTPQVGSLGESPSSTNSTGSMQHVDNGLPNLILNTMSGMKQATQPRQAQQKLPSAVEISNQRVSLLRQILLLLKVLQLVRTQSSLRFFGNTHSGAEDSLRMAILDLGKLLRITDGAACDAQQNRHTAGCSPGHAAVTQQQQDLCKLPILIAQLLGSLISSDTDLISYEQCSQLLVHILVGADVSIAEAVIDALRTIPAGKVCFLHSTTSSSPGLSAHSLMKNLKGNSVWYLYSC